MVKVQESLWCLPYCTLFYSKLSFLFTFKLPEDDLPEKPKYVKQEYDKINRAGIEDLSFLTVVHISQWAVICEEIPVFLGVMLWGWVSGSPHFKGMRCLHLQWLKVHKVATNILLSRLRLSRSPISHSDCMYLDYFLHSLYEDRDTPLDIIKVYIWCQK